jgi:hypothetical protein
MRRVVFFSAAVLLILVFVFLSKPLIIVIAKQQIKNVFIKSDVSIGSSALNPAGRLVLSDIEIRRGSIYDFKIKEARVVFNYILLLKRRIPKFYLGKADITINIPQEPIAELRKYFNLKPSVFLIKGIELSNLSLELTSKEMSLEATTSLEINPLEQSVNFIELKIPKLEVLGLNLENLALSIRQKTPGNFSIDSIQYDKAKIENLKSKPLLEGNELSINELSAEVFDGRILGNLQLKLGKEVQYICSLNVQGLDLDRITRDFELKEKFQISGKLSGDLAIKGKGADFEIISGNLSSVDPGGMLTITDDKFLNNVAKSSGQSLDILVESFKNYHYNTGIMKLSLEQGNLIFDVAMEGEAGKRNLTIVLHGFKL